MADLQGKVVLVTGATDGLGRAVSLELARRGATLLVHGRDAARGGAVIREIEVGGGMARFYQADYSALRQVAAFANAVLAGEDRLDVLVNNAGLGVEDRRRESEDGHEMLFQVDYLAGFLLTHWLIPLLERSSPARVVNVASAGQAPIDFENVMLERQWDGVQSYCQAKLAQISMTFDMANELDHRGITINALHPASMMPTKIVSGRFGVISTIEQGMRNVVRLATDPALSEVTGRYFNGAKEAKAQAQAYDEKARRRLRDLSMELAIRPFSSPVES